MKRSALRIRMARQGMSIVELLVAMAIISLLAGLILPAVLRSRESSRRLQCQNHLRQLGLAAHAHFAAKLGFPYTSTNAIDQTSGKLLPAISPLSGMLAYLDQTPVYERIDFSDPTPVIMGRNIVSYSMQNRPLLSVGVPVFRCPSDREHRGTNYRANMGPSPFIFWDSSGVSGCTDPGPKPGAGAFDHARSVRDGEFRDGLAHTVFFSERVVGDGDATRFDPWRDFFCAQPAMGFCSAEQATTYCASRVRPDSPHDSSCGLTWLFGGWQHTWYHHLTPPNSSIPDCNDGCLVVAGSSVGLDTARSEHRGGVNIVLGDGSVRFIAQQIDLEIWRAMSTRAGSDAAEE